MTDLDSVAKTAIEVSVNAKAGESILIRGWDHTIDLMSRLAWQSEKSRCNVLLCVQPEEHWLRSITRAPLNLIEKPSDPLIAALKESQAYVFTLGPRRPIPWKEIPERRRKAVSIWLDTRYDHSRFASAWARIAKKYGVRMLGIEATLATPERARALNLNVEEWRKVMFAGCSPNWNTIAKNASKLGRLLSSNERVNLSTPAGTRLSFRLDRRRVDYSDGITSEEKTKKGLVTFLPSGGIEVSIDEESAEGRVVFDLPVRLAGAVLANLKLNLKSGCVKEFDAERGRDAFKEYLSCNTNSRRLSFFGLGLNPNLRFGFTQDDKVLGGVTLGLGDNMAKGGQNWANGAEWWGAVSQATLSIGGTQVLRRGRLTG